MVGAPDRWRSGSTDRATPVKDGLPQVALLAAPIGAGPLERPPARGADPLDGGHPGPMVRADRHNRAQPHLVHGVATRRVLARDRVGQDDGKAVSVGEQLLDQGEGELRLGLELVTGLEAGLGFLQGEDEWKRDRVEHPRGSDGDTDLLDPVQPSQVLGHRRVSGVALHPVASPVLSRHSTTGRPVRASTVSCSRMAHSSSTDRSALART